MGNFKFLSKEKITQLPKTSGVYSFKNKKTLLYIGKAANIKERVKNHFYQPSFRDNFFINEVSKIGYIKTDFEIEALILEASLIKKYQPKYNVIWKDDKNYFFVEITNDEFPRVLITHQTKEKAEYIGPFVEGTSLKRTLTYLRKVFPHYTTKKHPKMSCLWCNLKLCPGPNPDKKEYRKNINNLISVLKGKSKTVLRLLKREMNRASASQNYEIAAQKRDRIRILERVISHSKIFEFGWQIEPKLPPEWQFKRIEAYDISNIQGKEATGSMVVFTQAEPDKSQYRKFKIKISGKPNDVAMMKEVLRRRLKHLEWPYPELILIDGGKAQLNAAKSIVKNRTRVMAIAKKRNKLYTNRGTKPILLKSLPREVFNLILQLRDESHRFAQKYHHKLRDKALIS